MWVMITGRKHGKCDYYVCPSGYTRGTIRWWWNFYLELAADKGNPGAERGKNSLFAAMDSGRFKDYFHVRASVFR